jgi:glycosyltransferase involved in cell wall biosynthesis
MSLPYDLVCLSHLRWDFVYQRPQHLLGRCARDRRVFFVEEPVIEMTAPCLDVSPRPEGVQVVVPHLPKDLSSEESEALQTDLLNELFQEQQIKHFVLWYYTPMAIGFTGRLKPLATIYDCMDELSAFEGASPTLSERESQLFRKADMVFTGGQSLYEVKRRQHPRVFAFPSSVDVPHFARARQALADPADQKDIPHPRIGFFGVVDERMDLKLLKGVAELRPDWQIVILGPVVKISPDSLPHRANIHYLGGKNYGQLPEYLSGWDCAILPFARNEATRFISPTKTPEYLAAGKPVISTSIQDVVRPYGEKGLVRIADTPETFVAAVESALSEDGASRRQQADRFVAEMSWDKTWEAMNQLLDGVVRDPAVLQPQALPAGA